MFNHFHRCRRPFLFIILLGTILSFGIRAGDADQDDNPLDRKKILSARLDSIEMEKQTRKRQGEPFDDLEEESGRIHDSIAALRAAILETDESVLQRRKASEKESFLKQFLKPAHIFDWIIIVVGFIALLSGIVLIIGLLSTVLKRSKRKPKSPLHHVTKKSYPETASKGLADIPTSDSYKIPDKDNRSIEMLRKRMQKDIEDIQRFNSNDSPFALRDAEPVALVEQEKKEPIRDQIICAAREGLDVQEISRKYHISVDQVSLILRVAKKGHTEKNR